MFSLTSLLTLSKRQTKKFMLHYSALNKKYQKKITQLKREQNLTKYRAQQCHNNTKKIDVIESDDISNFWGFNNISNILQEIILLSQAQPNSRRYSESIKSFSFAIYTVSPIKYFKTNFHYLQNQHYLIHFMILFKRYKTI